MILNRGKTPISALLLNRKKRQKQAQSPMQLRDVIRSFTNRYEVNNNDIQKVDYGYKEIKTDFKSSEIPFGTG